MTKALHLLAPAKLNLFLHITGRRADGYHELQTLFQLLDFGDSLTFTPAPPGVLALSVHAESAYKDIPNEDNLMLKAARELRQRQAYPLGIQIEVLKRLPPGAGLGGGSSNAAVTLLALNHLWRLHLPLAELVRLGARLGADVPVFLGGRSAWAEGIGERLEPVELEPAWYLVLTPDCHVATARIFAQENLTRNSTAIRMADFLAGRVRNDCESVTCELYPEVKRALDWLERRAPARMTGTGAAVFARFASQSEAQRVYAQLPAHLSGFVARGMNTLDSLVKLTSGI